MLGGGGPLGGCGPQPQPDNESTAKSKSVAKIGDIPAELKCARREIIAESSSTIFRAFDSEAERGLVDNSCILRRGHP